MSRCTGSRGPNTDLLRANTRRRRQKPRSASSDNFCYQARVKDLETGRWPIERPGLSYLPQFITAEESETLIEFFGRLRPIWEQRHSEGAHGRSEGHARRLTRPVYWLGAWQFASLGYYAEPDHRLHRCLQAEPFPGAMQNILERLQPILTQKHSEPSSEHDSAPPVCPPDAELPNTCLINYYGRSVGQGVPVDHARLRMHRDGEPGPVVMFNIGQAGRLEFLDPNVSDEPELSVWTRHRSVSIISGPNFKDRLYHRITQVRMGREPRVHCRVPNFELRRISVSFRHVPAELIEPFSELPQPRRERIREYVETLAEHSEHYRQQLR